MVTLDDAKGHFATKAELVELEKAINTGSGSAGDIIEPEIDPRLQNMIVKKYPFYMWLQSMGMIEGTRSNKPSFLKKVSGGAGSFIAEGGDIPSTTDSVYDLQTGTMTTHVFPIEITDQMIQGSQDSVVDIVSQEIRDGLEYNIQAINAGMLTGTGASNTIDGIGHLTTTNTKDMTGNQITDKFQLDDLCQDVMDQGGVPSAIVTSANVKSQIEEILYPNVQVTPTMDMAFGYQVTRYNSPAGDIPLIVDPAMPTTNNQQQLFVVDYSTLALKYLMEPRVIDLAKTKLTSSSVLASFQSFMCRAESFNGKMYNIGTKTS